jgi:heterodisulfide reductase subunit A
MTCALSIAGQGIEVHLVEREPHLGGLARRLNRTLEGLDVPKYIGDLTARVYRHPAVHVHTGAVIDSSSGYVGNFVSSIESARGVSEIRHGATVIATGASEYVPTEYRYGSHARVLTNLELEERMMRGEVEAGGAQSAVFIQCVGCRNEERDYCSRICCSHSIKNALALKRINPDADVYVLYRDMRTYGFREDYYRLAAEREVKFIRYDPTDKPFVEDAGSAMLKVTATDEILGKRIEIEAGFVVLAAAVVPAAGSQDVARLFSVPLGTDGFFKEAHVKLRPVDFNTDGVFLCGTAHYPKHIGETVSQALGAAGRVVALLSHDTVTASGSVCQVTEGKCIGCGACIQGCSYGAISMLDTPQGGKASVNQVLCKGDGLCASNCPTGAITPKHFTDEQLLNEIDAAFERAR